MFDIDRWVEIWVTITRNKTRSLLTGFGVFWGILIYDGYGVMNPPQRKDITIYRIDAMDKAAEMKNSKVFNMIVLGGLLKVCPVVSTDGLNKALFKSLPERHHNLIPLNMKAVEEGMKIIEKVER